MIWAAFESAYVSIEMFPAASREYEARATFTPPVVDFLPTRVKRSVWMQSAAVAPAGGTQALMPSVGHGFGFGSPPMPAPSMRTKFVPSGLLVTVCGVTPSP